MEQLKSPGSGAYYARYGYLDNLLTAVLDGSSSSNSVQLQALQQVLAWLLQLPAGQARDSVLDVLRVDGWLQQLLLCWEAEEQETAGRVAPQQPPDAAADGTGIDSSMAGLCQLLLQLLAECCKQALAAAASENAEGVPVQANKRGPGTTSSSSSSSVVQQLAGHLLAGTAALLLHWPGGRAEQQRLKARMWRSCLQYNLQRCRDGVVGLTVVAGHVQQRAQQVQACLPKE
jgi:hypothetical protein